MATQLADNTAIEKVSQESISIYGQVQALSVVDQGSYNLMVELHKASKEIEKAVHAAHDPVCDHWNKMHKDSTAAREKDLGKAVEAKRLSKSKYDAWEMEQERIRQAEERRKQEEAQRAFDAAQKIIREAQEAERKRLAAIEEADRLKLAEEAERLGATAEQVTEILDAPIYIPEPEPIAAPVFVAPTVAPTFQKAAGLSAHWSYSAKVVNLAELVKAAAITPHFLQYLQVNEVAINALARASKDAFTLPGCSLDKRRV
jgi:hypothetical protein